jgi:hypothetical protein
MLSRGVDITMNDEINIDGVVYVRKDVASKPTIEDIRNTLDGMDITYYLKVVAQINSKKIARYSTVSATGLEENPNSQIMTLLTINKAISHFTLQKF